MEKGFNRYRSHKVVEAFRIDAIRWMRPTGTIILENDELGLKYPMPAEWGSKHNPVVGGYLVKYADGYESFSPAGPFETGYTRIDGPDDPPFRQGEPIGVVTVDMLENMVRVMESCAAVMGRLNAILERGVEKTK